MHETRELKLEDAEPRYIASVQSDAGCIRPANEDSGRYFSPGDAGSKERKGVLTIVADGMGGHASGEIASRMAVDIVSREYYADEDESRTDALRRAVETANATIHNASISDENLAGMGTTIITLV